MVKYSIPYFVSGVAAGFPSPAEDYMEKPLDLNELVIKHPFATFFVRVEGDSMKNAGIFSDDILVVDRSLEAQNGKIIVALLNGEFTVKRLLKTAQGITLCPENESFSPIKVTPESEFQVWGVVTYVIHKV
jgi:DNA polymerase V